MGTVNTLSQLRKRLGLVKPLGRCGVICGPGAGLPNTGTFGDSGEADEYELLYTCDEYGVG